MASGDFDRVCRELSNEIAKILLNKVKKLTPTGKPPKLNKSHYTVVKGESHMVQVTTKNGEKVFRKRRKMYKMLNRRGADIMKYWSGYTGGTLRDAWTVQIEKQGDNYVVTLLNPTEYASYVEYGHRQQPGRYVPALGLSLKSSWVKGKFMMTISMQEIKPIIPKMVEKAVYEYMKEVFDAE